MIDEEKRSTLVVNLLWYNIGVEYRAKGLKDQSFHAHYDLETQQRLNEENRFQNRPTVYIHTSINSCGPAYVEFTIDNMVFNDDLWSPKHQQSFRFIPNSNEEISLELIHKLVFKYIDKHVLYAQGRHRNIQLNVGWSKCRLKKLMHDLLSKDAIWDDSDPTQELPTYYMKRFNVDLNGTVPLDWNSFHRKVMRMTKGKKAKETIPVVRFTFDSWSFDTDGDIDEIEAAINSEFNEMPKRAILI